MNQSLNENYEYQSDESWDAIVSEWVDGESEIRPDDLNNPYGRQVWDNYHLIGDVIRSNDLSIKPSDMFYARLSRAIDQEPTIMAPQRKIPKKIFKRAAGFAVAATVAGLMWVNFYDNPIEPTNPEVANTQVVAKIDDNLDYSFDDYYNAHQNMVGGVPSMQLSYVGGNP